MGRNLKRIVFKDKREGIWNYEPIGRAGIDFRRVLQKAKALEKEVGDVSIHIINGDQWSDITDWVRGKV